jgi:hypothetical protein
LIAARYPDRRVHVVGDAAYVGERLRNLQNQITWTSCCPSSILQTKPSQKMRSFIAGFVGVVTACSPR